MPSVETKIWLALRERIESMPLTFAKAWPAETFTPTHTDGQLTPYLRIGRVTVAPIPVFIDTGRRHQRTGTLIITLVHPINKIKAGYEGYGAPVYDEYAGQIAAHFAEGTTMYYGGVCVKITAQPHVQPGYEDNGYWQVPISIPWRTFA